MNTIAGISTPLSNGGISIIRLSGENAVEIADKVYFGKKSLKDVRSHTVNYGFIKSKDNIIDEVLVLLFKAPKSYTAEDVVEIHCHGGVVVTKKILELLLLNGAVLSEAGEFTKRAFLNGRIDLSQAESVMDIIQSKSDYELRASVGRLCGNLSKKIGDLRNEMIDDIARIEAALDDPEHYEISEYRDEIRENVNRYKTEVENLLKNADSGKIFKEGIKTVILGKPNVGKSSLLNSLMREDRAIVTDIAGTTRDTLEETILIYDMVLNVIDTAGIRRTDDLIEKIGVEKSIEKAMGADLILYMTEALKEMDEEDFRIIRDLKDKRIIFIRNKCDLDLEKDKDNEREWNFSYYSDKLRSFFESESSGFDEILDFNKVSGSDIWEKGFEKFSFVNMSLKDETGIEELKEEIHRLFYEGKIDFNQEVYISSLRQEEELKGASAAIDRVILSFDEGMPEDFITIDLMEAYKRLGNLIGEEIEDDIVDRVFSKFCMGK